MSIDSTVISRFSVEDQKVIKAGSWNYQTLGNGSIFLAQPERPLDSESFRDFITRQSSIIGRAVNFASHETLIGQEYPRSRELDKVVALGSHIWKPGVGPLVAVRQQDRLSLKPMYQAWTPDWTVLLAEVMGAQRQ